tara:strand:+ start:352 stop:549 length:198 start_codon:yes stop_codon:yes gene_type:complete
MINCNLRKTISYLIFGLMVLVNIACEDDPLLEPQTDTEEDKGSYGMLKLNEEDDPSHDNINPEVY